MIRALCITLALCSVLVFALVRTVHGKEDAAKTVTRTYRETVKKSRTMTTFTITRTNDGYHILGKGSGDAVDITCDENFNTRSITHTVNNTPVLMITREQNNLHLKSVKDGKTTTREEKLPADPWYSDPVFFQGFLESGKATVVMSMVSLDDGTFYKLKLLKQGTETISCNGVSVTATKVKMTLPDCAEPSGPRITGTAATVCC